MDTIPRPRERRAEHISHECRHDNEHQCGRELERPDHVRQMHHMRPEDEIDEHLPDAGKDEKRPDEVPPAEEKPDDETGLMDSEIHIFIQ